MLENITLTNCEGPKKLKYFTFNFKLKAIRAEEEIFRFFAALFFQKDSTTYKSMMINVARNGFF